MIGLSSLETKVRGGENLFFDNQFIDVLLKFFRDLAG
jgi:hypothetical protein